MSAVNITATLRHPGIKSPHVQPVSSPQQSWREVLLAETGRNVWLIGGVASVCLVGSIAYIVRRAQRKDLLQEQ